MAFCFAQQLATLSTPQCETLKTVLALMTHVQQVGVDQATKDINSQINSNASSTKQDMAAQCPPISPCPKVNNTQPRDQPDPCVIMTYDDCPLDPAPAEPTSVNRDSAGAHKVRGRKRKRTADHPKKIDYDDLPNDKKILLALLASIRDMFQTDPDLKTLFEFIRDWALNSMAGTMCVLWGPSYGPNSGNHTNNWGVGIHLGLLSDTVTTFIKVLGPTYKGVDLEALAKKIPTLIQRVTTANELLKKEDENILGNVFRDRKSVQNRFVLPVTTNFKDNILYMRINTFWNIMIVLGGKPNPWPLTLSQIAQLHARAESRRTFKQSAQGLEPFKPLDLETKEKIEYAFTRILRRCEGQYLLLEALLECTDAALGLFDPQANAWRKECPMILGHGLADVHWFSCEELLPNKKMQAAFALDAKLGSKFDPGPVAAFALDAAALSGRRNIAGTNHGGDSDDGDLVECDNYNCCDSDSSEDGEYDFFK